VFEYPLGVILAIVSTAVLALASAVVLMPRRTWQQKWKARCHQCLQVEPAVLSIALQSCFEPGLLQPILEPRAMSVQSPAESPPPSGPNLASAASRFQPALDHHVFIIYYPSTHADVHAFSSYGLSFSSTFFPSTHLILQVWKMVLLTGELRHP